ncbi:MAG TPA: hypothetical protein VGS10_23790 [Terracidiphilus sp.]|nr:hypothetical protein [Terracidiphilus sp.]
MMPGRAEGLLQEAAVYFAHIALNQAVWAGGLILECILAGILFSRRIAGRFPAFAGLMVFYPLRAVLLFVCQGRMTSEIYDSLSIVLSLVEFILQILVAVEIGLRWSRGTGGRTRRYWLLIGIAGGAAALAWGVAAFASGRVTVDRMEVFVWLLMAGLFALVFRATREVNLVRIAAGFAAFSLFQIVALLGRLHARAGQNPREYLVWSYVPAVGYIAVAMFWLVALRRELGAGTPVRRMAAR